MEMRATTKRIRPELIDMTGEPHTPMESVVGPKTAHLDKQFERVIRPIQKEYIQVQSELYEEEHVLLDGIIADMRDLLQHLYEYRVREVPDKNLDLFCELGYKSFKKRQEANFLMQMVEQQSELFYEEMYPPIAPEEIDTENDDLEEAVAN
jgi:hypothetical protein